MMVVPKIHYALESRLHGLSNAMSTNIRRHTGVLSQEVKYHWQNHPTYSLQRLIFLNLYENDR